MVNAAALASLCEASFKFTWTFSDMYQRNQHEHAIRHPHDTFEEAYIRDHVLDDDPGKLTPVSQTSHTIRSCQACWPGRRSVCR